MSCYERPSHMIGLEAAIFEILLVLNFDIYFLSRPLKAGYQYIRTPRMPGSKHHSIFYRSSWQSRRFSGPSRRYECSYYNS
ncbi:hypothetical protein M434DRAFT_124738 [Hypoxylon sp. CO27-5]|nr:hypothetical protein M434DRAFT_124738 [Hypoxylon sp. CO27-5]